MRLPCLSNQVELTRSRHKRLKASKQIQQEEGSERQKSSLRQRLDQSRGDALLDLFRLRFSPLRHARFTTTTAASSSSSRLPPPPPPAGRASAVMLSAVRLSPTCGETTPAEVSSDLTAAAAATLQGSGGGAPVPGPVPAATAASVASGAVEDDVLGGATAAATFGSGNSSVPSSSNGVPSSPGSNAMTEQYPSCDETTRV